jgi:signal transduction histidine kinase
MKLRRLWQRLSLRARLMVLGVAGVSAGLLVGGIVLVGVLGQTVHRTADSEARKTAEAMAELADAGALPDPLPVAGDDVRVQVVDASGRVLAASINADRLVPILYDRERPAPGQEGSEFIDGGRLGIDGPVRVVALPAGDDTVLVAKSLADLTRSIELLRNVLLIAFPLIVLGLALVAWRVVGATLRPVEALRSGAEAITDGARPGTLPVPASRDEINRLAVTLNRMLARLDGARRRQRAFVADAAHELRSPLANMRTQLEVAQRIGDPAEWPAVADDLLADVQRMSRLVDDLLLLAKADDPGATAPRPTGPVELAGLLKGVGGRYPTVSVSAVDGPLWTVGDEGELERVVANLLDNAVRHARSSVRLSAAVDRGDCVVVVADDGPGVPEADRERVFDRFTRLDDARARDAGGAGLGLSIVRELVRRHGGTVSLGDADPGLRVEVRLPTAAPV